ncbi:MAG: hypothetical protein ABR574_01925 [Cryomorphaceae bacterium]|nr:flippase-like domain-containing protein [Flavobacteriales bacterium]
MYKTGVTHKLRKEVKLIFSFLVFALLGVYIADNIWPIFGEFKLAISAGASSILLIFFLTIPNLLCEAKKWLALLNDERIGFSKSIRALLIGMATGFITPNRVGEFAGRVTVFKPEAHPKIIAMTWVGSTLQGSVTVAFGLVALLVFPLWSQVSSFIKFDLSLHILLFSAIAAILFLAFRKKVFPYARAIAQSVRALKTVNVLNALPWAVLRYVIFTAQIALALYLFGYSGSPWYCCAGISVMFLVQSYLPLTTFAELGVREFLAVLIFGGTMSEPALAAVATLLVWLANIGLPVAVGSLLIRNSKRSRLGVS